MSEKTLAQKIAQNEYDLAVARQKLEIAECNVWGNVEAATEKISELEKEAKALWDAAWLENAQAEAAAEMAHEGYGIYI